MNICEKCGNETRALSLCRGCKGENAARRKEDKALARLFAKAKRAGITEGVNCDLDGMTDKEAKEIGAKGACSASFDIKESDCRPDGDGLRYACPVCGWGCLMSEDVIDEAIKSLNE